MQPTVRAAAVCAAIIVAATAFQPIAAKHRSSTPLSVDAEGRPLVQASINGHGPFPFVVDTAAQRSAVNPRLAAAAGLRPEEGKAAVQGATGVVSVDLYRIDSLKLEGGAEFRGLVVPAISHTTDVDHGILGADAFAGTRVEFDFRGSRLGIAASGTLGGRGEVAVPVDFLASTFAAIAVDVNGVAVTAVVDTGARHSIGNPKLMAMLGYTAEDRRLTRASASGGVTGHSATVFRGHAGQVSIAGRAADAPLPFADLPVFGALALSERPAMILGMDMLRQFDAIAIDYGRAVFVVRGSAR